VDSHRRQKHSRPKGRLTPDQVAKLDRLAELARYNPDILDAIQQRIDSDMRMEILTLSTDELDALSDQLGLDPQ
jgi:hypothetical protein